MEVSGARRLKTLEEENRRLKSLLADAHLDIAMLMGVVTPAVRYKAVTHLM